jgi:protein Mpv17
MGAFGGLVHGPSGHAVYGWLERSFPGSSRGAVVKKVLVDQVAWSPVSTLLLFCFTGVTAGLAPRDICRAVSRSGVGVLLSAWFIWPLAHALNFAVVPARHRLLYVNVVQIMFNTILSFLVN